MVRYVLLNSYIKARNIIEADYDIAINNNKVQPYMFEPLANMQGVHNDDNSSSSESKDKYIHRIGYVEWLVAFS